MWYAVCEHKGTVVLSDRWWADEETAVEFHDSRADSQTNTTKQEEKAIAQSLTLIHTYTLARSRHKNVQ